MEDLRKKLEISPKGLQKINDYLLNPDNTLTKNFITVIEKHGGVDEIEKKANEAGKLETQLKKLQEMDSPFLKDIKWLQEQVDNKAFISIADYRRKILGDAAATKTFDESIAVTLEISACQYFEYLIVQAKQAIAKQELMPGRYIRVRMMKEQEEDGDLPAIQFRSRTIKVSWPRLSRGPTTRVLRSLSLCST